MKKAFTMIELIFVIVIIGILAAVAMPKLASTRQEAKKALVLSYIETLNRTVGATMYASTLSAGNNIGELANAAHCGVLSTEGNPYLDPIPEVTIAQDCTLTSNIGVGFKADSHYEDGNISNSPYWYYSYY